jgi:hypothetical protein
MDYTVLKLGKEDLKRLKNKARKADNRAGKKSSQTMLIETRILQAQKKKLASKLIAIKGTMDIRTFPEEKPSQEHETQTLDQEKAHIKDYIEQKIIRVQRDILHNLELHYPDEPKDKLEETAMNMAVELSAMRTGRFIYYSIDRLRAEMSMTIDLDYLNDSWRDLMFEFKHAANAM